jgi:peptide/nickel transport system permease protein
MSFGDAEQLVTLRAPGAMPPDNHPLDGPTAGTVWRSYDRWKVFLDNRPATAAAVLIILVTLFCFVGPLIYRTDQIHVNLLAITSPPGDSHLLGTDDVGYDVLGRIMLGGQSSIEIGLGAAALATIIGSLWGAAAGLAGGIVDSLMMRIVDALLSIPVVVFLLVVATLVTPSVPLLIVVIAAVSWLVPARLVRVETLRLKEQNYVYASYLMGARPRHVVLRHILPNALDTIVVNASFQVADAILYVAYLSFLGLGIPPPAVSWGSMLSQGVNYLFQGYWWLIWPAGLVIVLLSVSFSVLGDGLRDALDPRLLRR